MKTVNSISGGKTSAYIAANYPADYNVFALVRTNDKNCMFPDKKIRQLVSDKIGKEFIGTLEMDTIIYTMLDLEQIIGSKINWVSGLTFEEVVGLPQNNVLPSPIRRYCTDHLKMKPIFDWWKKEINEVVEMRIGFRANEQNRAKNTNEKLVNGLLGYKHIVGKSKNGRNKWETTYFQKPVFPLISIESPIYKIDVENYWKDKQVRFAEINNCVGCFHRNEVLLKKMWETHENKMQFFADLEKDRKYKNDTFKMTDNITYEKIKQWKLQTELSFDDFDECDSGYCGL
tara:strand:- start:1206 stop:2066 length:861 start_codon:yes stop_codon:yes gene_type:complete